MRHLVLADDSTTIQKVIRLSFAEEDFEIHTFANGTGTLEYLRSYGGDIVLADISLPHLDGYDLCREIRQDPRTSHVPVVLLAGSFEPFDPDRAQEAGYSSLLVKPFETSQLVELVARLVEKTAAGESPEHPPAPQSRSEEDAPICRMESGRLPLPFDTLPETEPGGILDLFVPSVQGEVLFELLPAQCRAMRVELQGRSQYCAAMGSPISEEQIKTLIQKLMDRLPDTLRSLVPEIAEEVFKPDQS